MPNKPTLTEQKLTILFERLEMLADSIYGDSYLHPLCAKDDVRAAIDVVQRLEAVIEYASKPDFSHGRDNYDAGYEDACDYILDIAKGENDDQKPC